jgi:hypothetical protein
MTTNTASEIAVIAHKHAEMACAAYKIELPESKKMRMFVPQYNHTYTSEFNRMMNELIESNS